jgi:hypothetical protein
MKRAGFVLVIVCLTLVLLTGAALGAAKKPPTQFPAGAKITVTNVPPFFWVFTWTAATGTFNSYRLDLIKVSAKAVSVSTNTGLATRYTCETVQGEGYPYVNPGDYKVTVNAMSGGTVAASLALKGTVRLK